MAQNFVNGGANGLWKMAVVDWGGIGALRNDVIMNCLVNVVS